MFRTLLAALLAAAVLPAAASAAVFSRDWKTPGDGLLTYDDVNKREWLDLSLSILSGFPGANLELRYQSVVAQTAPGGVFEGFSVGKRLDVINLAESAGINVAVFDFLSNQPSVAELSAFLQITIAFPEGSYEAMGFVDELFAPPSTLRQIAAFIYDPPESFNSGRAGVDFTSSLSDVVNASTVGVMLYRPVPEPATGILSAIAAGCIVACQNALKNQRTKRLWFPALRPLQYGDLSCASCDCGLDEDEG